MIETSSRRIKSLESLRGIAAVAVLLSHLVLAFWPAAKTGIAFPLAELWQNGGFAVRLFFVLSGFVLSLPYFACHETRVLSSSSARRYFRLYLPAAASVLFAYLLHFSGAFASLRTSEVTTGTSAWLQHFYSGSPSLTLAIREAFVAPLLDYEYLKYNEVLWTMKAELFGSLLVFAILALVGNARHRWLLYLLFIVTLDSQQMRYAVDFIGGMALCDWHSNQEAKHRESTAWWLVLLAGCVLGDLNAGWLERIGLSGLTRGQRWWPTIAAVCIVASAVRSNRIQRVLSIRPLVWLGQVSFALYLFHLPVLCSLGAWIYMTASSMGLNHQVAATVASLAVTAASFSVSLIGPGFLDPLSISTGKWFERQLFPVVIANPASASRPQVVSPRLTKAIEAP